MDKINISAIWSTVRYVVVAVGAFVVGIGWASAADWTDLLAQFDTVAAAAGTVVVGVMGVISRIKLIAENVKAK